MIVLDKKEVCRFCKRTECICDLHTELEKKGWKVEKNYTDIDLIENGEKIGTTKSSFGFVIIEPHGIRIVKTTSYGSIGQAWNLAYRLSVVLKRGIIDDTEIVIAKMDLEKFDLTIRYVSRDWYNKKLFDSYLLMQGESFDACVDLAKKIEEYHTQYYAKKDDLGL